MLRKTWGHLDGMVPPSSFFFFLIGRPLINAERAMTVINPPLPQAQNDRVFAK